MPVDQLEEMVASSAVSRVPEISLSSSDWGPARLVARRRQDPRAGRLHVGVTARTRIEEDGPRACELMARAVKVTDTLASTLSNVNRCAAITVVTCRWSLLETVIRYAPAPRTRRQLNRRELRERTARSAAGRVNRGGGGAM
jgi:hypothetical protein